MEIEFGMGQFYGADKKGAQEAVVRLSQDPSGIKFRRGSCVSAWRPLSKMFKGKISQSGPEICWTKGTTILARLIQQLMSYTITFND